MSPDALRGLAHQLVEVPGVVAVMLGGSRGRGEGTETSDYDLGLYYRDAIDIDALGAVAREWGGPTAAVTAHGGWGPWVDGGGWLTIDGTPVDLLYRDLGRVQDCWERSLAGEFTFHAQTGHPLGVPDFAYPGEVALGQVLADPSGALTAAHQTYQRYPTALASAVVEHAMGEARFLLNGVAKAAPRGDAALMALCLSRVLLLAAHAICAGAGRWVCNEKGLVAIADSLPTAPPAFASEVAAVLARVVSDPVAAVAQASAVLDAVESTGPR